MILGRFAMLVLLQQPAAGAWAASCEVGGSDLSFGAYSGVDSHPADSVGTIIVQCDSDAPADVSGFSIVIDTGLSGSYQPRSMQGAGDTLEYNLYVDAARSVVWGDGSGGSISVGGEVHLPAERSAEHLVYGRIPAGQLVAPGLYGDSLVVRVEF